MRRFPIWLLGLVLVVLAACQSAEPTATEAVALTATDAVVVTATMTAQSTATAEPTATAAAPAQTTPTPSEATATPAQSTAKEPEATPTRPWQIPQIEEEDWTEGSAEAGMVLVVYSDFQCPYCAEAGRLVRRLVEQYPDQLFVAFRHFPLMSIHDKAILAAEAAEAAGAQGAFWEMHDLLFARQGEWSRMDEAGAREAFAEYAQELDLDVEQFEAALTSGTYEESVLESYEEATSVGIGGTPAFFINGLPYNGPRDEFYMVGLIKLLNYDGPQYAAPPEMQLDPDRPYFATFETSAGTFCAELYADQTPQTVNSFVFLANEGFYDGVPFHRVISGFVAQTGDPTGGGFGGPGYRFEDEFSEDLRHDGPGILSMANAGPDSNGSQFFITYDTLPDLDDRHTVFGKVVEGMDVVENLMPRDPQTEPYGPADTLEGVTIGESCEP
jgi:cyclophilin family peptidyl-prolyl cis-trans isomerase/protein-disulfide isomerase